MPGSFDRSSNAFVRMRKHNLDAADMHRDAGSIRAARNAVSVAATALRVDLAVDEAVPAPASRRQALNPFDLARRRITRAMRELDMLAAEVAELAEGQERAL